MKLGSNWGLRWDLLPEKIVCNLQHGLHLHLVQQLFDYDIRSHRPFTNKWYIKIFRSARKIKFLSFSISPLKSGKRKIKHCFLCEQVKSNLFKVFIKVYKDFIVQIFQSLYRFKTPAQDTLQYMRVRKSKA